MIIKKVLLSAGLVFAMLVSTRGAEVPPAEQLLPSECIGLVTIGDWNKLEALQNSSPWGRLWADPAMKPFRDNFTKQVQADVLDPMEKEFGIKFSDYKSLLGGQITLAATPPQEEGSNSVGLIFLMDVKDKADQLGKQLETLRKKWSESGREVQSEKIRDVDFSTISFSGADVDSLLKRVFPQAGSQVAEDEEEEKAPEKKTKLHIGQSQSLLIVGENTKVIEKILAKLSGGIVTPLAENASFQRSQKAILRDALAYGWLNFKPIYEQIIKAASAGADEEDPAPGMPNLKMDKILPALGLAGLESLSGKITGNNEGTFFDVLVGVPEEKREGLFKIFTLEPKEAGAPAFVPADVVRFQRWRIDVPKAFAAAEKMLGQIDPGLAGLVQLMLSSAGKEQDPNFDLKKSLIGNFGDDFITYQKAPKAEKAADLQTQPSLILVGSPNPGQLLDAMRMLLSLMPPPLSSAPLQEREFLGRKIYSVSAAVPTGPVETADRAPATRKMSFTTSGGYVAFSTDDSILEEYLRNTDSTAKPLREVEGLAEAVQKIGGNNKGFFSYDNQKEGLRVTMQALKNDPEGFKRLMFFGGASGDDENKISKWFNVKLLPEYDAISKYFGFAVVTAGNTSDGILIRAFGPTPPGARQ